MKSDIGICTSVLALSLSRNATLSKESVALCDRESGLRWTKGYCCLTCVISSVLQCVVQESGNLKNQ